MTSDRKQALKEKVSCWLKEGIIRRVQYPEWIANAKLIKLANEEEELASLIGYRYKCFLWLPKDDIQIRIREDDEEKTGFHTEGALDAINRFGWINKAEKAFQKIKRKLNKLQTLTNLKEGEEKEVEGLVMKRFCRQGEQVLIVPNANKVETSELGAKL
ncbi:hypothetical protein Tco_0158994 [Tanacetum coccineum]